MEASLCRAGYTVNLSSGVSFKVQGEGWFSRRTEDDCSSPLDRLEVILDTKTLLRVAEKFLENKNTSTVSRASSYVIHCLVKKKLNY